MFKDLLLLQSSHHTNHIAVQCVDLILSATKVEVKCTNNKNILPSGFQIENLPSAPAKINLQS